MANQESQSQSPNPLNELDLAIPDMDSPMAQEHVQKVLHGLPGIRGIRMVERGLWVSYNALGISEDEILNTLRNAGLRASVFQSSETGRTGTASF